MLRSLAVLVLLLSQTCSAQSVYKCKDANGTTVFSERPCADAPSEAVTIRRHPESERAAIGPPSPPPVAAPTPAAAQLPAPQAPDNQQRTRPQSWRCEASNGEVWYQHARCPATIVIDEYVYLNHQLGPQVGVRKAVRSIEVSRSEACREINRPGASSRNGYQRDQKPSSYDKLGGSDPC